MGGSRIYGAPRPDSDVDLVILVSPEEAAILGANADVPNQPRPGCGSFPVRYGRLNLIVCTDLDTYGRWHIGRDALRRMGPVDREQARAMFERLGVSKRRPG